MLLKKEWNHIKNKYLRNYKIFWKIKLENRYFTRAASDLFIVRYIVIFINPN